MKKNTVVLLITAILLLCVSAWAVTKIRNAQIVNSTIDSSPIGATTPSTGAFTTLNGISGFIGTPRTCNANGCYIIMGDGTIEEWGLSVVPTLACSNVCGTSAVTFPYSFTSTTNLAVKTEANTCTSSCGAGVHPVSTTAESLTTNGFTVYWDGSGASISSSPQAYWSAVGH